MEKIIKRYKKLKEFIMQERDKTLAENTPEKTQHLAPDFVQSRIDKAENRCREKLNNLRINCKIDLLASKAESINTQKRNNNEWRGWLQEDQDKMKAFEENVVSKVLAEIFANP